MKIKKSYLISEFRRQRINNLMYRKWLRPSQTKIDAAYKRWHDSVDWSKYGIIHKKKCKRQ